MSEEKQIKIKEVVQLNGYSLKASGAVDLVLVAEYGELVKSVQVLQMLNNDVTIKAKVPGNKAMMLGVWRVKNVIVDGDGESKLKFNGLSDFIEMQNLNLLPLKSDDNPRFQILMEAQIEIEE
ncbi:hypothetical protein [Fibrobacter sp.]|uniref:hypothetical protein n=1 Tax=Fibrobacter sp. TaxID=35828 RepID=UPI0025BC47C0|nr:hypothetical protein [Fibrobacter sp.]MBR3071427.1 hypothetical protein [Fibrobacter sp.]